AGCFDGYQAVAQYRRQHLDHLTVAIVGALQLAPYAFHTGRQEPILERRTVAQCAWLSGEHRHVMPGIVNGLAATKAAAMLTDNRPVLADHHAISIRLNLDRAADSARGDRVPVVIETH